MVTNGSSNDSKILKSQLKQPYLCNQLVVNKNKKYYITDSLYDGKENINLLLGMSGPLYIRTCLMLKN